MPSIADRLEPTHLTNAVEDNTEDLKKTANDAVVADDKLSPEDQEKKRKDEERKARMRERRYTFDFRYPTDAKLPARYTGTFTSVITSIKTQQKIANLHARFNGGVAFTSMSPAANTLNLVLATLLHSFEDKDLPEWAKDFRELDDEGVLYALYEEVGMHRETFLGPG